MCDSVKVNSRVHNVTHEAYEANTLYNEHLTRELYVASILTFTKYVSEQKHT
jgi:hypothetical protein